MASDPLQQWYLKEKTRQLQDKFLELAQAFIDTEVHELKTINPYFSQVRDGSKNFELRRDDRGFQEGHILILKEYDPELQVYSGAQEIRLIRYILHGGQFGLSEGYVIMGLQPIIPQRFLP